MKAIPWMATAFVLCSESAKPDEPKKEEAPSLVKPIKLNLDHLDKAWNLQFKSMSVREIISEKPFVRGRASPRYPLSEICLTLTFTKDASDVQEIRKSFVTLASWMNSPVKDRGKNIYFYLWNEDNTVLLLRTCAMRIEGEVTGKQGDAFCIVIHCESDTYKKIKKIEPRPVEQEK